LINKSSRTKNFLFVSIIVISFILGLFMGLYAKNKIMQELPEEISSQLKRFKFINRNTGLEISDYKIISVTKGTYDFSGTVFETFVIGFEDRPSGVSADQDYLDLIIEIKRVAGERRCTFRMAQIGLDTIDVYLDDKYLGSLRPLIEVELT
jgi:uncharacterized protein YneF (UPF0154 family)